MRSRWQEVLITLEARGRPAGEVFAELFAQAKLDFVLNVAITRPVYLNLREVPFMRALQLLCEATQTRYSVREGVYYIEPKSVASPSAPPVSVIPKVRLVGTALTVRAVASEIAKQSGLKIEVAPEVPDLRLNLNLPSVEVETALDALCGGTGLKWTRIEGGYRIQLGEPPKPSTAPTPTPTAPPSGSLRSGSPAPRPAPPRPVPPDSALKCPKCRYTLQLDWRYCPICGAFVKHLTDRAKKAQESAR